MIIYIWGISIGIPPLTVLSQAMIPESDINVVSAACGYRDPAYFSKVFKRLIRKTPNGYIKIQKDELKKVDYAALLVAANCFERVT